MKRPVKRVLSMMLTFVLILGVFALPVQVQTKAQTVALLTDDMDNRDKMDRVEGDIYFDTSNPDNFGGDSSRLQQGDGSAEAAVIYRLEEPAAIHIVLDTYKFSGETGGSLKVLVSEDDTAYTELPTTSKKKSMDTDFICTEIQADSETPVTYIKIVFGGLTDHSPWSFQIGKISVTAYDVSQIKTVILDELDNTDYLAGSENASVSSRIAEAKFGNDTGMAAVSSAWDQPAYLLYHLEGPIETAQVQAYFFVEDPTVSLNLSVSDDGVNYTPVENVFIADNGTLDAWQHRTYSASAITAGTHYLKVEFGNCSQDWSTVLIGSVYLNTEIDDSSSETVAASALVDPLENTGKLYAKSENMALDHSNPENLYGDESRASMSGGESAFISYKLSGTVSRVVVDSYKHSDFDGSLKIFASYDDEIYSEMPVTVTDLGTNDNSWTHLVYTAAYLQEKMPYIKIVYSASESWAFQIGQVAVNQPVTQTYDTALGIYWNEERQTIEGYGAAAADYTSRIYHLPEAQRTALLNYLFNTETGLGLNIIRLRIWDDGTDGDSIPSIHPDRDTWQYVDAQGQPLDQYQVWLVREAKKRNPDIKVIALPWSPPGWMKTNGTYHEGGALREDMYQEFSDMLANYCLNYKELFDIDIYAVSIQNEAKNIESYGSCTYTGAQMQTFLNEYLKPTFAAKGVTSKIMASDASCYNDFESTYYDNHTATEPGMTLFQDAASAANLDIASGHAYAWEAGITHTPILQAQLPVWQTEVCNANNNFNDTMEKSMTYARSLHNYMANAQAQAWLYWRLANTTGAGEVLAKLTGGGNETPTAFEESKLGYVIGNYSRFIKPGFVRVQSESTAEVLMSAYKNKDTDDAVIVLTNNTDTPQNVTVHLHGFTTGALTPYRTAETENLAKQPDVAVENGAFPVVLPAKSVTTYTGSAAPETEHPEIILSAYKPVYASSNETWVQSNHGINPSASLAIDDYDITCWVSDAADTQSLYVDLLSVRSVSKIRTLWGKDAASAYEVQISDDAQNWTTVQSVTDGKACGELNLELAVTCRYVRIHATQRVNSETGYQLCSLQVTGPEETPAPSPDPTPAPSPDPTPAPSPEVPSVHSQYLLGYPDGSFRPNGNMTRAEAATLFYNLLENKEQALTKSFSDVKASSWYGKAVQTLASASVIQGYRDGTFRPNGKITRAEFVTMAVNFMQTADADAALSFTDVRETAWYCQNVKTAVANEWIIGYGNNTFRPENNITRAEAVTMINRILSRVPDKTYIDANQGALNKFSDLRSTHWAFYQILEAAGYTAG